MLLWFCMCRIQIVLNIDFFIYVFTSLKLKVSGFWLKTLVYNIFGLQLYCGLENEWPQNN